MTEDNNLFDLYSEVIIERVLNEFYVILRIYKIPRIIYNFLVILKMEID